MIFEACNFFPQDGVEDVLGGGRSNLGELVRSPISILIPGIANRTIGIIERLKGEVRKRERLAVVELGNEVVASAVVVEAVAAGRRVA